jgi:hypothetical protein
MMDTKKGATMERGHLIVTPEVAAKFNVTAEEVAKMTLGQFCDMVYNRGYDCRVSGFNTTLKIVQSSTSIKRSLAMWPTMKSEALLAVGMFAHLHAASL